MVNCDNNRWDAEKLGNKTVELNMIQCFFLGLQTTYIDFDGLRVIHPLYANSLTLVPKKLKYELLKLVHIYLLIR